MTQNIRYLPKSYLMSDALKAFFVEVTRQPQLQELLYLTEKLSDVAEIARNFGFNITGAEVLQAQAGRVLAILDEGSEDVQNLLLGMKPKTGAQWGRGGGGFLDRAGYWLNELSVQAASVDTEEQVIKFLGHVTQDPFLKEKLIQAKTFHDVAVFAQMNGFALQAIDLLSYQAKKILGLGHLEAERLAGSECELA